MHAGKKRFSHTARTDNFWEASFDKCYAFISKPEKWFFKKEFDSRFG